jgi:uncharacterized protein (TIGR00369 family)
MSALSDLASARAIFAAQPFSMHIGAELTAFEPGHAELVVPIRPELLQQFGFVHGGVLAYAADNALTFAGGSVLGPSILTRGFAIDDIRPARGASLRADARVITSTSRQALCRCDVFAVGDDGRETYVAGAQGTVAVVEPRG